LGLVRAGGRRTHRRRAIVTLGMTRARWVMGCWQHRKRVLTPPSLTAQVVVQQDRACATGSASAWGIPFRNAVGSRTRKVQEDLVGFVGQACDVRRQPHRARDRQVTQQSHSEQPHGRRLDGFYGASWLVRRGAAGAVQRRRWAAVSSGVERESSDAAAGCAGWPSRRRSE